MDVTLRSSGDVLNKHAHVEIGADEMTKIKEFGAKAFQQHGGAAMQYGGAAIATRGTAPAVTMGALLSALGSMQGGGKKK